MAERGSASLDDANEARHAAAAVAPAKPRVLVVDADAALFALLEAWLVGLGCEVVRENDATAGSRFDLLVADVRAPRHGGGAVLHRLAIEHASTPALVLSSSFFGRIESSGAIARALGVAAVLPKPLTRGEFVAAVRRLIACP
jgi:CheY-like chemotaxis protein